MSRELRFILHTKCKDEAEGPHWLEPSTGAIFFNFHRNLHNIIANMPKKVKSEKR